MFYQVAMFRSLLFGVLFSSAVSAGNRDGYDDMSMEGCGRSVNVFSGEKIVGGRPALEGEYPWQLGLEMRPVPLFTDFSFICGASLINKNWAVTAAHCIAGGHMASYRVTAGAMNISRRAKSKTSVHQVAMPYIHERYNPLVSLSNDIALLRLSTPVEVSPAEEDRFINGVCLPNSAECESEGMVTASGWGATSQGGSTSTQLRSVDVPLVEHEKCKEAYGNNVDDNMICAGYEEGGKDSCQGDSGGPLVKRGDDGIARLVGIVSWGEGCAQPGKYGVYTCTNRYMDWMKNKMQSYS